MVEHLGYRTVHPRKDDGTILVSQSDLAAYKANRRFWFLGTYLGLRPKDQPVYGPLQLGTRVHAALERHYGYGHDLVDSYVEIAQEERESLIESGAVFDLSAWEREADLGRIMLTGYVEWLSETGADSHLEVINAEEKLSHLFTDITPVPVELRGKIDLRAKDTFTGMNLVIDWKTTKNIAALTAEAGQSEQLLTYMLLERLNATKKDDPSYRLQGARFTMLRKVRRGSTAKPPFYDTVEVRHNDTRLRNFYTQMVGTLQDYVRTVQLLDLGVDHRAVAYPNPASRTTWSPFFNVSTMMDDGSHVEEMLQDLYVQDDPHARYSAKHESLLDFME